MSMKICQYGDCLNNVASAALLRLSIDRGEPNAVVQRRWRVK